MEDFVTWTHTSAIRKHVMEYNEMVSGQICVQFYVVYQIKFGCFFLELSFCTYEMSMKIAVVWYFYEVAEVSGMVFY